MQACQLGVLGRLWFIPVKSETNHAWIEPVPGSLEKKSSERIYQFMYPCILVLRSMSKKKDP